MYILLTDETNKQPSDDVKFFVYGGLFFPIDCLPQMHCRIAKIRREFGYQPGDNLKFDTNARPKHVSLEQAKEAKCEVIDLCVDLGCKFIAHIILHDIIRNQNINQQLMWSADYVIGRYNRYLDEVQDDGICILDNLPVQVQFRYLSDKFTRGLSLSNDHTLELNKIKLFAATCLNASHANSAMDIVLGSFRYCVNNPRNIDAARTMMRKVARLMWHKKIGDKLEFGDMGLITRPKFKDITHKPYRDEYDYLYKQLRALIMESD